MDFEEDVRKAREYYAYGDYGKAITFYKSAVDRLRRFCSTLTNPTEKKRGNDVRLTTRSSFVQVFLFLHHIFRFSVLPKLN